MFYFNFKTKFYLLFPQVIKNWSRVLSTNVSKKKFLQKYQPHLGFNSTLFKCYG